MKRIVFLLYLCVLTIGRVCSEAPAGYYDVADGKSGAELKTTMHQLVKQFLNVDFDGFTATYWGENYFKACDWHSDGYYWDMYSQEQFPVYDSGKMAREHCMPRSWWGTSSDYGRANGDLNNLFPAESKANGQKSNLPLGETTAPIWTNDVVKIGPNTYEDFPGKIFEPKDEYKGDFARTYMYMVTCYEDYGERWKDDGKSMLNNDTYPVFKPWAIEMLLEWNEMDPVSDKERSRNDSVFKIQQNRNPYIDCPELAEYVWGEKVDEAFVAPNKAAAPTLMTPSTGASINFGSVLASTTRTRSIPVKGIRLTSNLTVDFLKNTSNAFSTDKNISVEDVNKAEGYMLSIKYQPTETRKDTAVLRISGDELEAPVLVQLWGSGVKTQMVNPVEPTDDMDVMLFYTGPWKPSELPEYMSTNGTDSKNKPYANGDFALKNDKDYLIVTFDEAPGIVQFSAYPRSAWGSNDNHLYVYEGTDSENFEETPISDLDKAFMVNGNTYNNTSCVPLSEDTRAIKIEYKKIAQNVGVNNLIITRRSESTLDKSLLAPTDGIRVYCADGLLTMVGEEELGLIRIYAVTGELVAETEFNGMQATLSFTQKGVFLLKANQKVYKFIAK